MCVVLVRSTAYCRNNCAQILVQPSHIHCILVHGDEVQIHNGARRMTRHDAHVKHLVEAPNTLQTQHRASNRHLSAIVLLDLCLLVERLGGEGQDTRQVHKPGCMWCMLMRNGEGHMQSRQSRAMVGVGEG